MKNGEWLTKINKNEKGAVTWRLSVQLSLVLALLTLSCSNGNILEKASEKTDPYRWKDSAKNLAYEADLAYAQGNRAEACRLYAKAVAKDKAYGPAVSGQVSCALEDWAEVNGAAGFAGYILPLIQPTYCRIGVGCTEDPESEMAKQAGFVQANWTANSANQASISGNTSLQNQAAEGLAALRAVKDPDEEVMGLRALLLGVLLVDQQFLDPTAGSLHNALGSDYYSFLEMAAMELRDGGRRFREDAAHIREFNSMLQSQPSFAHQYIVITDPSLEEIRQDPTNGGPGWDVTVDWSKLEADLGDLQNRFQRLLMVRAMYDGDGTTWPGAPVGANIEADVATIVTMLAPFYRDSRADNGGAIKYIFRGLRDIYLDLAAVQDEAAQGSYYVGEFNDINSSVGAREFQLDDVFYTSIEDTVANYLNAQDGISGAVVNSVTPVDSNFVISDCDFGTAGTANILNAGGHYHSDYPAEPCTGPNSFSW